jgi:hypothetical protein
MRREISGNTVVMRRELLAGVAANEVGEGERRWNEALLY